MYLKRKRPVLQENTLRQQPRGDRGDRGGRGAPRDRNGRSDSSSASNDLAGVDEVLRQSTVGRIVADQCQLGQEDDNGDPIRKPTGFMSNSPILLRHLNRRCFGRHGLCSCPAGGAVAKRVTHTYIISVCVCVCYSALFHRRLPVFHWRVLLAHLP